MTATAHPNGLDTHALVQTVNALKRDKTLARFEFGEQSLDWRR
jgi:hypothetical protein